MKILMVYNGQTGSFTERRLKWFLEKMLVGHGAELTVYGHHLQDGGEYDVIVMLANDCMSGFHKKRYEQVPVVFFAVNTRENVHIPRLKNLAWVFYIDSFPKEYIEFPRELSSVLPMPYCNAAAINRNSIKNGGRQNLVFIGATPGLYVQKQVMAAFNEITGHELWMFVPESDLLMVKEYANENIRVKNIEQYPDFLTCFDLVITSGLPAVEALMHGIPVIVAGDTGFGGLVSAKNVPAHIKQSFTGRIGGTKGERIPVELIMTELQWAYTRLLEGSCFMEPVVACMQEWFDEEKVRHRIIERIQEAAALFLSMYRHSRDFLPAIPVRAANVAILKSDSTLVLRRVGSMRTISELQEEELLVFNLINGTRSIGELLDVLGTDLGETDVVAFIQRLWEEKIIYFKRLN